MRTSQLKCTAVLILAVSTPGYSQDGGSWIPDSKTVDRIEETIRQMPLPTLQNWTATAIDSYGRYYTGQTRNGHKIVVGVFLATDPVRFPHGVHIVSHEQLPGMAGGLCGQLDLLYDVTEQRVTAFRCYGLG